jgi:hypothetical protein
MLARRAGFALKPESQDFLVVWLDLLKESGASRLIRRVVTLPASDEDPSYETDHGSITNPCGASAVRCCVLEADATTQKRGSVIHMPNDTRILLSAEALKRVDRAHVEAERFIWEAEVSIETRALERDGMKAKAERIQARLKKARLILSVLQVEYSRLTLSDSEYHLCINGEIEAASNSLELYDSQKQLLETEFFFQLETPAAATTVVPAAPEPTGKSAPAVATSEAKSIAEQISRLRKECRWTIEELAEISGLGLRSVQRHIAGKLPYDRTLTAYERVFSKHLKRQVVIKKMA